MALTSQASTPWTGMSSNAGQPGSMPDGPCALHRCSNIASRAAAHKPAQPAAAHLPVPCERPQLWVDCWSDAGVVDDPELREARQRCKTRHGLPSPRQRISSVQRHRYASARK